MMYAVMYEVLFQPNQLGGSWDVICRSPNELYWSLYLTNIDSRLKAEQIASALRLAASQ